MATPFTIKIFLADGTPDGLRVVEKTNWTGIALCFPRTAFAGVRSRKEFGRPGVYVLGGASEAAEFAEGTLVVDGAVLRLVTDYLFSAPSAAAGVLLGRTANGLKEWKDENGRPLSQIRSDELGEPDIAEDSP